MAEEDLTIDFCPRIPRDVYKDLLKMRSTYNDAKNLKKSISKRYDVFRENSDSMFRMWLEESNKDLVEQLDEFIESSLNSEKSEFFSTPPETVHVVTVVLGMQASDHLPTIDMIEEHVNKNRSRIQVVRLQSDLSKKAALMSVFDDLKYQTNILAIVERSETFQTQLLGALVLILSGALKEGRTKTAMIMVCMSSSIRNITTVIPLDVMNRIGKLSHLVKDPKEVILDLRYQFFRGFEKDIKLGPNVAELIDLDFTERDASLANLKYLYQYAVLTHLSRQATLIAASKKEELDSLDRYHQYIFNQMTYYFHLVRDQIDQGWPTKLQDIIIELGKHGDLGQSALMQDAISRLNKFPPSRLLSRLKSSLDIYYDHPWPDNGKSRSAKKSKRDEKDDEWKGDDIYGPLKRYELILTEAEDKTKVIMEITGMLHNHVKSIRNPWKRPSSQSVYFDNGRLIKHHVIPSTRRNTLKVLTNDATHLGILYSMIHGSTESISLADLFADFKAKLTDIKNEELVKAIFVDLIKCMEHKGLVKFEIKGKDKDSFIKRTVWL